jgi:hypothetical protein
MAVSAKGSTWEMNPYRDANRFSQRSRVLELPVEHLAVGHHNEVGADLLARRT